MRRRGHCLKMIAIHQRRTRRILAMEEKKNEELFIDNVDRRAFLVYFKHAQYFTFDEVLLQHKSWSVDIGMRM